MYDQAIESKQSNKDQAPPIMLANSLPMTGLFARLYMIVYRSILVELGGPGGTLVVVLAAFLVVFDLGVALLL